MTDELQQLHRISNRVTFYPDGTTKLHANEPTALTELARVCGGLLIDAATAIDRGNDAYLADCYAALLAAGGTAALRYTPWMRHYDPTVTPANTDDASVWKAVPGGVNEADDIAFWRQSMAAFKTKWASFGDAVPISRVVYDSERFRHAERLNPDLMAGTPGSTYNRWLLARLNISQAIANEAFPGVRVSWYPLGTYGVTGDTSATLKIRPYANIFQCGFVGDVTVAELFTLGNLSVAHESWTKTIAHHAHNSVDAWLALGQGYKCDPAHGVGSTWIDDDTGLVDFPLLNTKAAAKMISTNSTGAEETRLAAVYFQDCNTTTFAKHLAAFESGWVE